MLQVLCYKSLALWNSGRFSDALSTAAVALEHLVKNLKRDDEALRFYILLKTVTSLRKQ